MPCSSSSSSNPGGSARRAANWAATWIPTFSTHQVSPRFFPRAACPSASPTILTARLASATSSCQPPPHTVYTAPQKRQSPPPPHPARRARSRRLLLPSSRAPLVRVRFRFPLRLRCSVSTRARMDGAADAAGSPGMGAWASIRGYFTPATLFLVVNIVIGTIALTSRTHQRSRRRRQVYEHQYHHDGEMLHHHQLQPPPLHQQHEYGGQYYGGGQHQQMMMQETLSAPPPAPPPLARTSSVLDRLRSFGLYRFRSGDFPPEYATAAAAATGHHHHTEEVVSSSPVDGVKQAHDARSRSEPAPAQEERKAASRLRNSSSEVRRAEVVRAPARVVEAFPEEAAVDATADEFIGDFTPKHQDLPHQQEYVPPPAPAALARTSSFLDRLRSFSLYSFRSGELATDDIPADAAAAATPAQAHYGRTRSEPAREQNKKAKKQAASEAKTMTKSSSEARKEPAAEDADDGGVDARADDFINKFRQQLQLQRLNSLLNYKEMLNRGSSKQ